MTPAGISRRVAMGRLRAEIFTVKGPDGTQGGTAEPARLVQDHVEYGLEIAGRGVDDLQYLGGRGLLLQSFAGLGQEPRVLHRDHCLRCEVLEQRNLLVSKGAHLLAIEPKRTQKLVVLAETGRSRKSAASRAASRRDA